jgi:non-specific serine/threonine protein kinase/serine/threonine-protein kinase
MGTVYRGSRDDGEFVTSVAVKVLNRGLDTDYFVRRFRYERQLLAYLDHPAIVRLLDGGSTPDGRPYLVTEFVDGEPLPACLARTRAPLRRRLVLLITICDAVHHAHQRLILHCDLKPNNILVSRDGHPKLLDFGVGRIFLPSLGAVEQTSPAQKLITPGYASPEQLRGDSLTTATDVFSLGATLFELLAGRAPFQSASEAERRDPGPPSRLASATGLDPEQVAGDLDRITAKAMEQTPADRYESAEQLAADLKRHLDGQPILARPHTARYRIWKFVRRNPGVVLSLAVAAAALILGSGVAVWQWREALKERDYARRLYENSRQLARAFVFEMDDRLQCEGAIGARRLIVERGLQ